MKTPISTLFAYAIVLTGFLYFAIQVSTSYFDRQVVSETLIEQESPQTFPNVAFCWDPIITISSFQFNVFSADFYKKNFLSGYNRKRENSIDLNIYHDACQNFFTTFNSVPNETLKWICPMQYYNWSLEEQIGKPFRRISEVLEYLTLSFSTTHGPTQQNLTALNFTEEIIYRDALRCHVVNFNLPPIDAVQSISLSFRLNRIQGNVIRRLYVIPQRHLPRSNDKYIVDLEDVVSPVYNRITLNRLPYPFRANCRHYSPRFKSREHCFESCVKSKIDRKYLLTSLTYTHEEITMKKFSNNIDLKMLYLCQRTCKQIDCRIQSYTIYAIQQYRFDMSLEPYQVFYVINQIPKTTLAVFIIYLGDLTAAFFGVSCIALSENISRVLKSRRLHQAIYVYYLKRRHRKFLTKLLNKILGVSCLLGFTYQSYSCFVSYLQYETYSATHFENKALHRLPKISICIDLFALIREKYKISYFDATVVQHLSVAPNFSYIVERLLIRDGVTGITKMFDSADEIIKIVQPLLMFLYKARACYLLDLKQEYKTAELRLNSEPVVKLHVGYKTGRLTPDAFIRFQGSEFIESFAVIRPPRNIVRILLETRFGRVSKTLLSYPYTQCIDRSAFGYTFENSCKFQCLRKRLSKNSVSYMYEHFTKHISSEMYNFTLEKDFDGILSPSIVYCDNKCNINYCLQDYITEKTSYAQVTAKDSAYNVLLYALPFESTYITMSPKMSLTDLFVYLSGIVGVWFGLDCSNIAISLITYFSRFNLKLKPVLLLSSRIILLGLFAIQMKNLILDYTSYNTVMQIDIKYLSKVTPPHVSLCFDACKLLNIEDKFKSAFCSDTIDNVSWSVFIKKLNVSWRIIEDFATRNPDTLEWEHIPSQNIDRFVISLPKYFKNDHICFAYTPQKRSEYDVKSIGLSRDVSWLKVVINKNIREDFVFKLLNRDFRFNDAYDDEHCRPHLYVTFARIYSYSVSRTCEWWNYKSTLLPYPYNTNCFKYSISQSHCYRTCLDTLSTLHISNEFYDMDANEYDDFPDLSKLSATKRRCVEKCKRPDCKIYFSHLKDLDRQNAVENRSNEAKVYLTTKLYETSYQPKMSFSEFVIYVATYLGILLGINALIIEPVLRAVHVCLTI